MSFAAGFLLVCLAVVLLIRLYVSKKPTLSARPLKSCDALPIIGHAQIFVLKSRQAQLDWLTSLKLKFGNEPLQLSIPTLPAGVYVQDPAQLQGIFADIDTFQKGDFFSERSHDLFGDGIVNANGEIWKVQRRVGRDFLSASNHQHLCNDVLPTVYRKISEKLNQSSGAVIDFQALTEEFALSVMGFVAFGQDLSIKDPFVEAFNSASGDVERRLKNPFWKVAHLLTGSKTRRCIQIVRNFGIARIRNRLQNKSSLSLLDDLYKALGHNERMAADASINFLSAGRDTVYQSILWTLYEVLRHPHHFDTIRKEVKEALATSEALAFTSLTADILTPKLLPFTHAVFHEGIRLHPPIPIEIRQAQQDTTLAGDLFLPSQTLALWSPYAMQRDPDIYGKDALEFVPSRWLDTQSHFVNRGSSEFPVFNGGPRNCLGRNMAIAEGVFFLAALSLEPLDVSLTKEDNDASIVREPADSLTLPMIGGLLCTISMHSHVTIE